MKGEAIKKALIFLLVGCSIKPILADFQVCTRKFKALVFYAQPSASCRTVFDTFALYFPVLTLKLVSIRVLVKGLKNGLFLAH